MLKHLRRFALPLCALALASSSAIAQSYPNKPIKMVVGFAPGGPTDILARTVAAAMEKSLGQSVIIENKGGGGGLIAAASFAKAEPDGYTVMFAGDGQLTLLPQMFPKAGYDTQKDFVPVRTTARQTNVLMVNKSSGVTDVASLLARAKAAPGTLSYGSAGNGTPTHLIGVMFENSTGAKLLHVPYKGAGPAMVDLLGSQIDMVFVGMPVAMQHMSKDQLVPLAVTGNKRAPGMPKVPTFAEAGVRGLGDETDVWWAVVVRTGTPDAVKARLDAAVKKALASPELRKSFQSQGVEILDLDTAATNKRIERDQARWKAMIDAKQISLQ